MSASCPDECTACGAHISQKSGSAAARDSRPEAWDSCAGDVLYILCAVLPHSLNSSKLDAMAARTATWRACLPGVSHNQPLLGRGLHSHHTALIACMAAVAAASPGNCS